MFKDQDQLYNPLSLLSLTSMSGFSFNFSILSASFQAHSAHCCWDSCHWKSYLEPILVRGLQYQSHLKALKLPRASAVFISWTWAAFSFS